jgi:penicillin amidase
VLGSEWPEPYRATRITDLLRGRTGLTPDDFARIQSDTLSLHAKALLPLLLNHARPSDERDKQAVEILSGWDFDAPAASNATAIFQAWFLHVGPAIAGDELGREVMSNYAGRFSFVTRFLIDTLGSPASPWCDDVRTRVVESCGDTVTRALHEAMADLAGRLGGDAARWRWDAVHPAVFPHQGLDSVAPLRALLSRSIPNGGDWSTPNVGIVSVDEPYEQHSAAGYRQIIDLSPAGDSRFIIDLGQSGHVLSRRYDDFLRDWQQVRHRPMRIDRRQIEDGAIGRLRLTPAEGARN